jgi:hypothetical protein
MRYTAIVEETIVEQVGVIAPDADAAERVVVRMLESESGIKGLADYQRMPGSMEIVVAEAEPASPQSVDVESLLPECEDLKTLSDMWEPTQGVPVLTTDDEEAIMCAVDALNSWSNMFSSPDKKRKYHDAAMFIFCRLEHAKNEANKTAHRAEKEASENV